MFTELQALTPGTVVEYQRTLMLGAGDLPIIDFLDDIHGFILQASHASVVDAVHAFHKSLPKAVRSGLASMCFTETTSRTRERPGLVA
jgi:hypothetical protein